MVKLSITTSRIHQSRIHQYICQTIDQEDKYTVTTPPSLTLHCIAASAVIYMTMILCGWIVFILQLGSVFSCDPTPSDSCCPDEDECCNDGVSGVCCNENKKFYVPDGGTADECLCSLSSRRDSLCVILRIKLINMSVLVLRPFVWGFGDSWGEWQHCPPGGYVVGMMVMAESYQGSGGDYGWGWMN